MNALFTRKRRRLLANGGAIGALAGSTGMKSIQAPARGAGYVGVLPTTGGSAETPDGAENFATLDPNFRGGSTGEQVTENDLKYYCPPNDENYVAATLSKTTGKWYFECLYDGSTNNSEHGIVGWTYDDISQATTQGTNPLDLNSGGMLLFDGRAKVNAANATSTLQATSANDVFGVAFDADTREIWFSVNGTWAEGDPGAGTAASSYGSLTSGKTYIPFIGHFSASSTRKTQAILNFGQDATFAGQKSPGTTYTDANGLGEFYSEPPAGFVGLYDPIYGTIPGDEEDPHFDAVSLLVKGDTLTDSSNNAHTLTANGNAAANDSEAKYASGSLVFDGTGDYITVANDATLDLGDGDFTVEMWVNLNTLSGNQYFCDLGTNGIALHYNSGFRVYVSDDGSDAVYTTLTTFTVDTWHHVALTRQGNTKRVFVDGAQVSTASTVLNSSGDPLTIGAYGTGAQNYTNGNIEDLRITKGVARYTAAFTPPARTLPTQGLQAEGGTVQKPGIKTMFDLYVETLS